MKKIALRILLLAMIFVLAGCGCKHEVTKLMDVVESTCTSVGYSGDTYCVKCKKIIAKGEIIEARPHTEGELTGAKEPDCTKNGYTGDVYCTKCGEIIIQGEIIPAQGHTEGAVIGAYEATCTRDGYTGNTYCVVCDELLSEGVALPAYGHTACEPVDVYEPTCFDYGYTGDVFCATCNECIHQGELIDKLAHTPGELQNVAEATCQAAGYTGDIYCQICDALIKRGQPIAKLTHTLSEPYDVVLATCLTEGYTGSRRCTVCDEVVYGKKVAKSDHRYVHNICSICDWRVPGLYVEEHLEMTWDQLLQGGYVEEVDDVLTYVSPSLYGTLVVRDGLTLPLRKNFFGQPSDSAFQGQKMLSEIYLPKSVEIIPRGAFSGCTSLQKVKMFGDISYIGDYAFNNCSALMNVELTGTFTSVEESTFYGCQSLTSFDIPESVQEIVKGAFYNCASLTEIELQDGLISIGNDAFRGTGITELIVPSSVTSFGKYGDKSEIQMIDLSNTSLTGLCYAQFSGCSKLVCVKLPNTLTTIGDYAFNYCSSLETLILPPNVEKIGGGFSNCSSLKTVVWPVSLQDGRCLAYCSKLETIYYSGSEFQWSLTAGNSAFENVNIVYNYDGDGSELIA